MQHTAGRSGFPKSLQRLSDVSCTQRTPAGFPFGMPGIGEDIEGAIQHAPQPTRHSMRDPRLVGHRQDVRRDLKGLGQAVRLVEHSNNGHQLA